MLNLSINRAFSSLIEVGRVYTLVKSFSYEDVKKFSQLSTDLNPIHHDEVIASQSRFKKRVVHGLLGVSLFSGLMGNNFSGAIYLDQSVKFVQPIFLDEEIQASIEILGIVSRKNGSQIVHLKTTVNKVQDKLLAIDGEAHILIENT